MNRPMYYYLVSTRHDWVLHKKGCDSLYREKNKLFIGTLYTDHQAVGIAKQRVSEFSLCQYCISKHEHGQFREVSTTRQFNSHDYTVRMHSTFKGD